METKQNNKTYSEDLVEKKLVAQELIKYLNMSVILSIGSLVGLLFVAGAVEIYSLNSPVGYSVTACVLFFIGYFYFTFVQKKKYLIAKYGQ